MNIWSRLGLSVAFSAGFYILMVEVLQKCAPFQTYKMQCIWGLLGGGGLLAFLGLGSRTGRGRSHGDQDGQTSETATSVWRTKPPGLLTLPYCGCMLMVFGVITLLVTPAARSQAMNLARSLTARARPAARPSLQTMAQNPLAGLKLQGIIYRPANPSAVINGQPVFVGETVAGATVKAITTEAVILARGGSDLVLSLPRPMATVSPGQ